MPQRYIDFTFVKEHAAFEPVLAHYDLPLIGQGVQRAILCPFHRERTASCKLDLARKIFNCFGCGAKGNILEFVARLEGDEADLRAAALKIAEICEIATAAPRAEPAKAAARHQDKRKGARARKPSPEPKTPAREPPAAPNEPVNPPLTFALKLDPDHPYLAERGLSNVTVAEFGLGCCNRGSMAGRICIPIHNEQGELVAYAGRWPGDEGIPEGEDRYKLPAKFQKSRVLFNLHRVFDAEHVVLVEGYWSAIRLHALGVPVAALMGWSVSPEQLALLRERGTRYLTLLLDGDDAGRRGRERALPDLASSFFVRAPELPDGQKPDTLPEAELLSLVQFPTP
jgi:DNA primase